MTRTIFMGGAIRTCMDGEMPAWALVEGDAITGVGAEADMPSAERVVDLGGACLIPAFCDAHAHLPATGLYAAGMDFRNETSTRRILDAFKAAGRSDDSLLFGGNFEDPLDRPLLARDMDEAVGGRPALLARADMHSCIVSSSLLHRLDLAALEGVDRGSDGQPTGYLREEAAARAWRWFEDNLPPIQLARAISAATNTALAKGIATVHEMFVVEWRGWPALNRFLDLIKEQPLRVKTYIGTDDVDRVVSLGYDWIGGDYFLDGAFGSHTAWMSAPYESPAPSGTPDVGIRYREDDALFEFFAAAQAANLQVGVHAIGDAAIDQAISAWEKVAAERGVDAVRGLGHRLEHFECARDDLIRRAASLGLRASIQPAFDALWGGPDGLYARRIGWERARHMNRFAAMLKAGMIVGAGSDSTVTPMDPFLQLHALRNHHLPEQSLDGAAALRAHTVGSHALAGDESERGAIAPGYKADLAIVDRDPVATEGEELLKTTVLATWIEGIEVFAEGAAS